MRGLEVFLIIGVLVVLAYGVPVPTKEDEPQLRKNQWKPGKKGDIPIDKELVQANSGEDQSNIVIPLDATSLFTDNTPSQNFNMPRPGRKRTLSEFSSVNDPPQVSAEYKLATGDDLRMSRHGRRRTVSDLFSVIDPLAAASKQADSPPMVRPGRKRRSHTA